ncbi:aromatic ring-hydroxylating dioxygenase subunit alpha [Novosphingobium sp. KCTC 2891]|uniref:aromatic ring-hydroxylating oxygenase subunit alpha n=1 Tax=Novosphingobium sp. KCTC 2891 TaxID=2989730 RepID=UPI002221662D|nr:aromatic ring-hydroxylating dioxygenase subunit alpha [Novosphingobium sp. KCTC 2891]MCW1384861.1 aromatic ring-hydroxylating dioxygenase subunit alpha [Novosphingobium sp. KCTC 2891]
MGLEQKIAQAAADMVGARKESGKRMQRGMMQHLRDGTTSRAEGPMRNVPGAYTDPERFEAEKRELFRKLPLFVGLTPDIPNPGDKLLFDAAGPSIVVVRNKAGKLNAFLNMCTHRAATLVHECDARTRMTCKFHGWTFDLDGQLIGQPGSEGFAGIDRAELGLIRVPVAEWHGMIFVRATPGDEEIDVAAYLGEFAPELAQLDFANAEHVRSSRVDVNANWKYALDTYGESYHFGALHPDTIAKFSPSDVMFYDGYAPHHRIGFPRHEMKDYAADPEETWPEIPHGGVHLLFPNTIIQVEKMSPELEFVYGFYRMFPGESVDKAYTLMSNYRPVEAKGDPDMQQWIDVHELVKQVVSTEDYSVSEGGQKNLTYAPDGFRIVYGSNEIALQRFHRKVAELIGETQD